MICDLAPRGAARTSYDLPELELLSREAGIHAVVPKHKVRTHLIPQAEALVALAA